MRRAHIPNMVEEVAHTPLARWMRKHRHGDQWLADQLGVSQPQASRIKNGKSRPSLEGAVTIERVTGGDIRPADLLAANDPTPSKEAA